MMHRHGERAGTARLPQGPAWPAACLGWVGGTALQLQQGALWPPWAYAILAAAAVLALLPGAVRRARCGPAVLAVAMAVMAFSTCGIRAQLFLADALEPALEGRVLRVTGTVAAMPQPTETGVRFRLDVDGAFDAADGLGAGRPVRLPPRIELGWYSANAWPGRDADETDDSQPQASDALRAGDRWELQVRLRAPHGNRNPHGFDYELWLWERGVQATGTVRAGRRDPPPRRLSAGFRHPVERLRQSVREAIVARLPGQAAAGVVVALSVGDQGAIERADWDLFRATGVAHLMSISGLHVTMFAWLASAVVGWAWRRADWLGWRACLWWPAQHAGLAGGVALATLYALFSGWGVPAQRTVAMLAIVALLRLSGRAWPWPARWLLALAAVLVLDPWALLQPGLWLSFVAVGVLFASDAGRRRPHTGWRRGGAAVLALLREQAVVTVALAPLSLLLFQQVSLVGLLANLLAIPWVTLVVTPLALGGALWAPLWNLAALAVGALSVLLAQLAAWPWAVFAGAAPPLALGVAAVGGCALLVLRLPWPVRALGLPLLLPALLWQPPRPGAGEFELLAADVGQGNAVLLRTAQHALLYDTGPRYGQASDAGQRVLVPLLRGLDERLDTVLVSHGDADHAGGALAVLAMQPQAHLLASLPPAHPLQAAGPVACAAGQRWTWDGVWFELLHPPPGAAAAPKAKANAVSCVLRVRSAAGRAVLLTGDIEQAQEAALLAADAALRADVLLVPHHGSKTSSSAAFVAAVAPRFAVVQAGYRNRFGHPAPEVVRRLQAQGATLVETARCGAATWRSEAPAALTCERRLRPRYWQHPASCFCHSAAAPLTD